ncbi:NADH-ubiquinone oxidoreductase-F iron-sulfur binding region domain-containing protein [Amycolatopsis sp. M39]|uniref:NADH-ubiquinone oxidoreductase-F iron-sulfur binding region domain-containing protein n=1 Tax=Amycolatopsis sp. M39 TaxID=1825094 RepID=UPI0007E207F7|nr:NADH-ubiquinone oxidoreductase-F iron-sulfur binding region domain-containing protein [Amycolatopsis sp. M39]MYW96522.1 proton-conducting membrane transporter [Amycolatopsis rubida]OAP25858.1 NADH-quinone oxidoreductase subunit 1 [Amycolatopsis sp. M39]
MLPRHRQDLAAHLSVHGGLPDTLNRDALIHQIDAAGIRGRGGAGFPSAAKLRSVAPGRSIVVANGCESDPFSSKDRLLLELAPHLVLDGIQLAAYAVGATEAFLCLHEVNSRLQAALAERRDAIPVKLVAVPPRHVASEETALVHFLSAGDARPTGKFPRPIERGLRGRPTLVQNVETLARFAIVARIGADRYRSVHTDLVTVTGAVTRPGVLEVPADTPVATILARVGGSVTAQAVLIGGYGGTWMPRSLADPLPLGREPGLSSLYLLPEPNCGLGLTANILSGLAAESARQCGPCMFGLPAVAADFAELLTGRDSTGRLARRLPLLSGRGACAHPDGAVRLAASALRVFAADVRAHLAAGSCRVTAGAA